MRSGDVVSDRPSTIKPLRRVLSTEMIRRGKRTCRMLTLECGHTVPQSGMMYPPATRARCFSCLPVAGTEAL